MPITKNGVEWYTAKEMMALITEAPHEPIRLTTEGWENGKGVNLRTKGLNNQGSMGYYLINNTLDMEPYWRFTSTPPTPPLVLDERINFQ